MLTWTQALSFVPTAIALLVVPGPSVLFVVSRAIGLGKRAALASVAGNELGTCCHLLAAAAGAGAVVQRSTTVFTVMKLAGAGYLIWLGIGAMRRGHSPRDEALSSTTPTSIRRLIRDGFVVGATNPKSTLFFLAVLPQFVVPDQGNVTLQLVGLGVVFLLLATVNDVVYGVAAGSVRHWLLGSSRRGDAVGGVSGLLMIGLGIRLVATGRAH